MSRVSYRDLLRKLFSLNDTPQKIALSFAVGVYISISPLYGFHTLLAVVLSFIFGLNKVATVLGSWFNNPWTTPLVYYIDYKIGAFLLKDEKPFSLKPFTFEHYLKDGKHALVDMFAGSVVFGIFVSILTYFLVKYLIERYKRRKEHDTFKG